MNEARLEAVQACCDEPIYAPLGVVGQNIFAYLEGSVSLSQVIYIFNMIDSRNLGWIDCMMKGI